MKLSKFFNLVYSQSFGCMNKSDIENVMMECAKEVYSEFVREDCLPSKPNRENRSDIMFLFKEAESWSKGKILLILTDFAPFFGDDSEIRRVVYNEGESLSVIIQTFEKLSFWQLRKKARLSQQFSEADKELSLKEEIMFLWSQFSNGEMGSLDDFKKIMEKSAETAINELVKKDLHRFNII